MVLCSFCDFSAGRTMLPYLTKQSWLRMSTIDPKMWEVSLHWLSIVRVNLPARRRPSCCRCEGRTH